jgi:membrane associated rhomboid family serine protease
MFSNGICTCPGCGGCQVAAHVSGAAFFTIGPLVHNMLGNTSFLALYMFSGLTGSVAHLLFRPTISHGLGASGASTTIV